MLVFTTPTSAQISAYVQNTLQTCAEVPSLLIKLHSVININPLKPTCYAMHQQV